MLLVLDVLKIVFYYLMLRFS